MTRTLFDSDIYYLKSILRHLREVRHFVNGHVTFRQLHSTLGGEVLADNIDWLDCFIDKHERGAKSVQNRESGE